MSDLAPLVELRRASHVFPGGLLALDQVDLAVIRGEFISLLGPSGCGKSTALRMLAGLELPTSGEVLRGTRGDVGFIFQEPTLMPWATVADNVSLPLRLHGWQRERIDAAVAPALAAVGLADFARAVPRELSGGMKMRASIARALVTQPELLLLDEPFAALDEITRFRLNRDLVALWQSRKFTAVFVTHSVYEAVFVSQRVLVMSARPGRIRTEIVIDAPYPRDDSFRATPEFARYCADVSQALVAASDSGEGGAADRGEHANG